MITKTITIDYNDIKSIKNAEKQKVRLENKGYTLTDSVASLNEAVMVYKLIN